MAEARDAAAAEAAALQRSIAGLNARIRSLTDDLDKANSMRRRLAANLRRQLMEELRGAGWTAPKGYVETHGKCEEDDDETLEKGFSKQRTIDTDPIAQMRKLRASLEKSVGDQAEVQERQDSRRQKVAIANGNGKKMSKKSKKSNHGAGNGKVLSEKTMHENNAQ